ncbi:MAG: MFS transporter [Brachymonas sp.]|nr:MFS transporter [Brachymonas sp.]
MPSSTPSETPRPQPLFTYVLLALYLAQGLPVGFITQALPVVLREQQASLVLIGWSGMLLVPWSVKFLWAPLQDRYYWPRMGLGRSWIVPMQVLALLAVGGLAWQDPARLRHMPVAVAFVAMLLLAGLAGAVQDVATDGLAVRLLTYGERSMGNAIQVAGSRLGQILGGGGVLLLLDVAPWRIVMGAMFILMLLTTVPVLLLREPDWRAMRQPPSEDVAQAPVLWAQTGKASLLQRALQFVRAEFGYFVSTPELRAWLWVLLAYKLCESLSSGMVKPMLVDMGYSKTQIGLMVTMLGAAASLIGAGVAHALLKRMARWQALLWFNGLQAVTTGLYALVHALHAGKLGIVVGQTTLDAWVYGINALEHMAGGMAMVAIFTTIMDYCRHKNAGSDFTVQVSVIGFTNGVAHLLSGYMAQALGFELHFVVCAALGLLLLAPVGWWSRLARINRETSRGLPQHG